MSEPVIKVENLSKLYRIGAKEGYKTFRETLIDSAKASFLLGRNIVKNIVRPFPRETGASREENTIWALKDVSFEVKQGEVVGIIGRNGAGKSTLLKILSKITEPTEGRIELKGRVGSLLEVGTGFHPELTGHENVYLYGAILGMDRWEVTRKFDEIIAFAELEKFVDTPVKRYSSGMYMRLAFAVAAHLEPEILLVDEVLAVGDAAFQKKCLGKMREVSSQGRTVFLVSHNMRAIARLCNHCVLLQEGRIQKQGFPVDVIDSYILKDLSYAQSERIWNNQEGPGDESCRLLKVRICQPPGRANSSISEAKPFEIEICTQVLKPETELAIALQILTLDGQIVLHSADLIHSEILGHQLGQHLTICEIQPYSLNAGTYVLSVGADVPNRRIVFIAEGVLSWSIEPSSAQMGKYSLGAWKGVISPALPKWHLRE